MDKQGVWRLAPAPAFFGLERSFAAGAGRKAVRLALAFTLVELLTVIAIVVILAGILLPSLGSAKKAACAIECKNHLRQIGQWGFSYADEWNGVLPHNGPQYYTWLSNTNWPDKCPYYTKKYSGSGKTMFCPAAVLATSPYPLKYGYCYNLNNNLGGTTSAGLSVQVSRLSSQKLWFLESYLYWDGNVPNTQVITSGKTNPVSAPWCWMWYPDFFWYGKGHPGSTANLCFGDGHVENMSYPTFYSKSTGTATQRAFWAYY